VDFCYGANAEPIKNNCFAAIQSLSGTGALRVMGEFIARFKPMDVYVPNPTWQNHVPIFSDCGLKVHKYRYYDTASKRLNFLGMLEDVNNAPSGSCILLHAAAHNPTGLDPSIEQWRELSRLVKTKNHFVIFDNAYQGYVSGDPVRDAESIALFVRDGHQLAVAQSYAKNFGLYGQRVGCLSILVDSPDVASRVESQLKILVRPMYSSPPLHGARIVATILEDPRLRQLWQEEVKGMADRIRSMREKLVDRLSAVGSKHDWSHIVQQNGMFCFSGLTPDQVAALAKNHSVYLTLNGRISMAGVTSKNVEKLAVAVHDVTKN
jgi:aspartate aminotransferase